MPVLASILVAAAALWHEVAAAPPSVWDGEPHADPAAIVIEGDMRFTVLTPALVRIQVAGHAGGAFDDRASAVVINRRTPVPPFTVTRPTASTLVITTAALELTFDSSTPAPAPGAPSCGFPREGMAVLGGVPTPAAPYGLNASTQAACCAACSADTECVAWTFVPANATCQPWVQAPTLTAAPGSTSGTPYAPLSAPQLSVRFALNASAMGTWVPGAVDDANLPGTYQKLECYAGGEACYEYFQTARGPGLVSRNGWFLHDDTRVLRLAPAPLPSAPTQTVPWLASAASEDAVDWYLLARGKDYPAALGDWVAVSGAASMPQAAAFGVAWSRWYKYSAASFTEEVLQGYADHGLPLAMAILDMDWHNLNSWGGCNSWGSMDWNTTLFPDPAGFSRGIVSGANPLGHSLALGLNFHDSVGVDHCEERYAAVAARMGVDPASNASVACNWADLRYVDALYSVYVNAAPLNLVTAQWADWGGCDPPHRAPYNPPGAGGSFHNEQFSNLWWANHAMAVMQEATQGSRAWNLYRFGGLGQQRYPVGFAGDTFQSYATLRWEIESVATAANVVFPYWSYDIGGYMCETGTAGPGCDSNVTSAADAEMLLRWLQFGAFAPVLRTHCQQCERRLWLYQLFPAMRDALRLRTALGPYLYSEARATYETGVAPLHPLYYEHPEAEEAYDSAYSAQYMFGGALLAAPVFAAAAPGAGGVSARTVWLPPGAWATWNGTEVLAGPRVATAQYGLGDVPVYARAGAVVPLKTARDVVAAAPDPLVWAAFPTAAGWAPPPPAAAPAGGAYTVYEDDGVSLAYRTPGAGARTAAQLAVAPVEAAAAAAAGAAAQVTLSIAPVDGTWPGAPAQRSHWLQLRGWPADAPPPAAVTVNGAPARRVPPPDEDAPAPALPSWWIAANHSLACPAGALVVASGPQPVGAATVIAVTAAA